MIYDIATKALFLGAGVFSVSAICTMICLYWDGIVVAWMRGDEP